MFSFNSQIFIEPNLYQTLCWAPRKSLPSRSLLEELQKLPAPLLKRLREKETVLWRVRKQYLKPDTWPKNENILHSSRKPTLPFWPCLQGRLAIPAKQLFIYLFFIVAKYTYHKIYIYFLKLIIFGCPGMWDLVSQPGVEPRSFVLRALSLSNWTTREIPNCFKVYSFVAVSTVTFVCRHHLHWSPKLFILPNWSSVPIKHQPPQLPCLPNLWHLPFSSLSLCIWLL